MTENDNDTRVYSSYNKPRTGSLNEKMNNSRDEYTSPMMRRRPDNANKNSKIWIGVLAVIAVILLGVAAWLLVDRLSGDSNENTDLFDEIPLDTVQMTGNETPEMLDLQQKLAESEFENLEKEFSQFEISQQQIIVDDSKKQDLQKKYDDARKQVDDLRAQLKKLQESDSKNAAEIIALSAQIKTLRELLKHYLEEIDRLNKENQQLRTENTQLRQNLDITTSTLSETQAQKEKLDQKMQLAEKLNVTGVSFNMINKKGKVEKKIKNATKFLINFTIPQNNSTPPGTKNIYAVITTPEGHILEGGGAFSFEGNRVTASTRGQIDYGGQEIGGLKLYYDIRNALNPGTYTVQLFCDGYALMARPLSVTFND